MAVIRGRRRVVRKALGFLGMFVATVVAAGAGAVSGQSAAVSGTGTLELRASLRLISNLGVCPPEITADACAPRTGAGPVPGLGSVTETYTWSYRMGPPTCPSGVGKPLATIGRLVAGKGEIRFAIADGARCIDQEPLRNEPQDVTITGGTGGTKVHPGAAGSSVRWSWAVERRIGP